MEVWTWQIKLLFLNKSDPHLFHTKSNKRLFFKATSVWTFMYFILYIMKVEVYISTQTLLSVATRCSLKPGTPLVFSCRSPVAYSLTRLVSCPGLAERWRVICIPLGICCVYTIYGYQDKAELCFIAWAETFNKHIFHPLQLIILMCYTIIPLLCWFARINIIYYIIINIWQRWRFWKLRGYSLGIISYDNKSNVCDDDDDTWYFWGPTAAIQIPMLTSSPCNETSGTFYLYDRGLPVGAVRWLPDRASGPLRSWRATGPDRARPRSPSRRRTPGRPGWRTPAPATSRSDPPPSSAWNWVRTADGSQSDPRRLVSESRSLKPTSAHLKVQKNSKTYFPHQKFLRSRRLRSIFMKTASTST